MELHQRNTKTGNEMWNYMWRILHKLLLINLFIYLNMFFWAHMTHQLVMVVILHRYKMCPRRCWEDWSQTRIVWLVRDLSASLFVERMLDMKAEETCVFQPANEMKLQDMQFLVKKNDIHETVTHCLHSETIKYEI